MMNDVVEPIVAVIGAGPAGLFAARDLASNGVQVMIFNRDIKPGGLAEYGIYPDKLKMKEGLRKQFRQILSMPNIHYFGNVLVGLNADLKIDDLMKMGFSAVLVTVGAQATKWLGLPGEDLNGVYHAKDIVYHYNRLPPFSQMDVRIGKKVAVVGAGNVMLDLARWLINDKNVPEVLAIVRRGPAEVKFDRSQLEYVASNLNWQVLADEFKRVTPLMKSVGADPRESFEFFRSACEKAVPASTPARMSFQFLAAPTRIMGDENGNVKGLEVEENTLILRNDQIEPAGTNNRRILEVDTILFAIGDRVDSCIGLPTSGNEFLKNPVPRYPIDEQSYEIFDPAENKPLEGIFMAGWARKASAGLVGVARKDGSQGASAVLKYLEEKKSQVGAKADEILEKLASIKKPLITKEDLIILEEHESKIAAQLNVPEYKYASNMEMLKAIGRVEEAF
jgi:ferredoxin--NADP+ reductase